MAITASSITTSSSLEQFRQQFNSLVDDVNGLESGTQTFTTTTTTESNIVTLNIQEDGKIVFEGATADRTITLPNETGTVLTTASTITSTSVNVSANNTANETVFPVFVDGTTGSQELESDSGLSYNPSTELLTVGKLLLDDGATIGVASSTSAITVASTGIVTFVDDIVIKDGGTIGSSTTGGAITIAAGGGITTSGELVVGSLLKMPTNTSARILVADGTSYEEVAVSGDVTISSTGAVTIGANAVEGSMLNTDVISAQTELASGLAETDEILISDAGTLKRTDVSNLTEITDGSATALAIALG